MKHLHGFDLVFLAYVAAMTLIVVICQPAGTPIYLAYHAGAVILLALIAYGHANYPGWGWSVARYWYIVYMTMGAFRELHYLIPAVRPFEDLRYDRQLEALDHRWFGDVDGFFVGIANPILIDILHLCYWSYFALLLVPRVFLHARGEMAKLREYDAALLTALFLSYLAYFLIPSVGPHHLHPARPPELDGWIIGRHLHALLMAIEWTMPDAFPSGHTMATLTALIMSARLCRKVFWWLILPGTGIVAATMALRYHYVVDVLAGITLVPIAVWLGAAVHRSWERRRLDGSISG